MEKNNRPYSVQDILNNFQGRLKKPLCQKVMEELTEAKIFACKEYGKARIYLINQDLFDTASEEQLTILDEQIKVRKDELYELQDNSKKLTTKVKEAQIGDTNDQMALNLEAMKKEVLLLEQKLEPFKKSGAKVITQDELNKSEAMLKKT